MRIYPENVARAVEQSKQIAEDSKKLVQPVQPHDDGPFVRPLHQPNPTKK